MKKKVRALKSILVFVFALLVLWEGNVWGEADWQVIDAANSPDARIGHGMTTLPDGRILLFGGENDAQNIYNDLFAYDSKQWSPISSTNTPPAARRDQVTWYRDGKLYIHGGVAKNHEMLDDLWAFDVAKKEWAKMQTGTTKPPARYGHAATPLDDGSVVLTGGMDKDGNSLKDAWKLNTDKTYTSLGNAPIALANHAAQLAGDVIYLFGEPEKVVTYNTKTNIWTETAGGPPISGAATSSQGENGKGQKIVYIFGGVDKNGAESDIVYEYNTATNGLTQRKERMPFPQKRAAAASLNASNLEVIVFGGISNCLYTNKTIKFTKKNNIGAPMTWGSSKIAALFADYGSDSGVWSHDGSGWGRLTDWQPAQMSGCGTAGIIASFNDYGSGNGLWSYEDSAWRRLTDWFPANFVAYGNGDKAAQFTDYGTGNGIWKYSGENWTKLTDWTADRMVTVGNYNLAGSFSKYGSDNGIWSHSGTAWTRISEWVPAQMSSWGSRVAGIFSAYGESGNGVWLYDYKTSAWQRVTDWVPDQVQVWKDNG